jgi:uncharacterized protein (DUF488 family)
MAKKRLYTIGYEGLTLAGLLSKLKANKVAVVVDVREVPNSRKRGFSKSQLDSRLGRAGISYVHFKSLGSTAPVRKKYKRDGDFNSFARSYMKTLKKEKAILRLAALHAVKERCCLLCYEDEAEKCHRSLVANEVAKQNGGSILIEHL